MFKIFYEVILIIALVTYTNAYNRDGNVLVLMASDFEQAKNDFDYLFLKWFAPWCEHCKQMYEDWKQAAEKMEELKIPVQFAEMDAATIAENKQLAEKDGLEGYPTIKLYKKRTGEVILYKGNRKVEDFINFARNNVDKIRTIEGSKQNKYEEINNVIELDDVLYEQAINEFENILIHFYKDSCPKCAIYQPKWNRIGKELDNKVVVAKVNCDKFPEICKDFQKFPTVAMFEDGKIKNKYETKKSEINVQALVNFAKFNLKAQEKSETTEQQSQQTDKADKKQDL